MFALIAPDGFQRIFDDGYCKNCSKIRGSCSSRDPARRVSPAGPLCHCFAGIMRSNCALEEGRREERENKKKEEGEKRKKRKRRKRKERGTNRVGRTIDREEKKSPLLCPQESRGLRECFARVLCTRVPVRAGKVESERKSALTDVWPQDVCSLSTRHSTRAENIDQTPPLRPDIVFIFIRGSNGDKFSTFFETNEKILPFEREKGNERNRKIEKNRENGAGVCSLNGDRMAKILRNDSSTTLFLAYLDNFLGKQAPLSCDDDDASFIEKLGERGDVGLSFCHRASSIISLLVRREEK